MPFVKLDCDILDSTLWVDRDARDVFLTSLLKAQPFNLEDDAEAMESQDSSPLGFTVPAGPYGFARSSGIGLIRAAGVAPGPGFEALDRLASPEPTSRTSAHGGRRLVRIDGGFIVLNFDRYRKMDYTAAERQRRYRDRKREALRRDVTLQPSRVTQAEAEAEAESIKAPPPIRSVGSEIGAVSSLTLPATTTTADIGTAYAIAAEWAGQIRALGAAAGCNLTGPFAGGPSVADEKRRGLASALECHERGTVLAVVEHTARMVIAGDAPMAFLSRIFIGDGFNARLTEYEDRRREATRVEAIERAESDERARVEREKNEERERAESDAREHDGIWRS